MSEDSTVENQAGASPARQMLAALTHASREMTTKFNEILERATKLNAALESDVNKSLEEINRLAESVVQVQLEGLSAEKDAVLAELIVLRQQELKVLQSLAANMRDALNEKMEELVSGLKNDIKEQLAVFQRQTGQKEVEVINSEKSIRKVLRDGLPGQIETIQSTMRSEKKDLESLHFRHEGLLAQESRASLEKIREHGTELKGGLAKEQSNYLESVEITVREMVESLSEKIDKRVADFSSLQGKASPQIQVDMDFLEKLPVSFTESCRQVAELRVKMHDNAIRNLSTVYGDEIVSLSRETEDQMVVVRSQLNSLLRNYQDFFVEQSAMLLWKFEKDATEEKPVLADTELQGVEVPVESFEKLRTELRKITRDVIADVDSEMEQSFAEFRTRLNSGSQEACALIEVGFHDCRKKVTEYAESHKEALEELAQKGNALEQLVDEAKDLLVPVDLSDLDF
jgi:hypothetical protein